VKLEKFLMWSVKAREVAAVVHRLKTDLHNCVGYIQDPKLLKDSIKAMYHKHVHEDTVNDKPESPHLRSHRPL